MKTVSKAAPARSDLPSAQADVTAFIEKLKEMPASATGKGRLVFAMDATMSRQPTWDRALSIQGKMFQEAAKLGGLQVQLVYFRGLGECRASRWVDNASNLANLMTKVDCRGGNTQISRVLSHVRSEATSGKVNAVILVGDACEENVDALCQQAGELGLLGTPFFMFQEGNDAAAASAFREIARITRGAYFKLDDAAPQLLADLLAAVAGYASGGRKALEANTSNAAKVLLQQLK